jgi:hypothetical protein
MQKLPMNQKNNLLYGHYQVGSTIYTHKLSALIDASKSNTQSPTWHFHDNVYSQLNWQEDPKFTLDTLYQQRAKQLRDKYDYLVLSFSGGSDSWTVLQAFIDSGTHLDEIFVRWPITATYGKYSVNTITSASNMLSEWELTIRPMLDEYQKIIPNTKITVHDWSDELLTRELDDSDWSIAQDHLNPGSFLKFQSISISELQAIERGKRTAIIFGTDKPELYYENGNVYCHFKDKSANGHAYSKDTRVSELFYWTPDLPNLVHAQAREIYNYININKQCVDLIDKTSKIDFRVRRDLWNSLTKSIIYKKYSALNTFQVAKCYNNILDEVDAWMVDIKDFRYIQSWKSGIDIVLKSVNPKFLTRIDNQITGLVLYTSGKYCLGPISVSA